VTEPAAETDLVTGDDGIVRGAKTALPLADAFADRMMGMEGMPIKLGVLADFSGGDGGLAFEWAVRLGLDEVGSRLPGPVELVREVALGLPLPGGSEESVRAAFTRLDSAGVLAVLGPAITDNALVVRPMADAAGLATLNYSGGEQTRSYAGFQYQIGSLEDEPAFLAAHLLGQHLTRVALVHDTTFVGRRMADFFGDSAAASGLQLVVRSTWSPGERSVDRILATIRAVDPEVVVSLGMWELPRALSDEMTTTGWTLPAYANSALIYGHQSPEAAKGWEGWTYCDTFSEENARYEKLNSRALETGRTAGPGAAGAFDMGRLTGEGLALAHPLSRAGMLRALERVKSLPAASGHEGTLMGFGRVDRAALKGRFIVMRQWRHGESVPWTR
jgi:branched-chain amino acid transport system substrate-binding protein